RPAVRMINSADCVHNRGHAMRFAFASLAAVLLSATPCLAHEAATDDMSRTRVQIDARASQEVENDTMRALLYVEMEDVDPGKLADRVNRAAAEAVRQLKAVSGVRVRTSGYHPLPGGEEGRIVRWRARYEWIAESEDFKRLSEGLGRLQGLAQLGGVDFFVSSEKREKAESELTEAAIRQFLHKAELVAKSFQGATYHVAEATVSGDGGYPPPRPVMAMKAMA